MLKLIMIDELWLATASDYKKKKLKEGKKNIMLNTLKMVTIMSDGAKEVYDLSFHKRFDSS